MTPFSFEQTFQAPSVDALLAAYFDPDHQAAQDLALDILEREVIELVDTATVVRRVCRVVPRRQLPALVRPFVTGPLHYLETVTWQRPAREVDVVIQPSLMKGRARVEARYVLAPGRPGSVDRRYEGQVSVDVAMLARRIEAGIVAEFSRSLPIAARCTQAWLDRASTHSASVTDPTAHVSGTALV